MAALSLHDKVNKWQLWQCFLIISCYVPPATELFFTRPAVNRGDDDVKLPWIFGNPMVAVNRVVVPPVYHFDFLSGKVHHASPVRATIWETPG